MNVAADIIPTAAVTADEDTTAGVPPTVAADEDTTAGVRKTEVVSPPIRTDEETLLLLQKAIDEVTRRQAIKARSPARAQDTSAAAAGVSTEVSLSGVRTHPSMNLLRVAGLFGVTNGT